MNWSPENQKTFELNRQSWDERVEAHWQSAMYQRHVEELRSGKPCLDDGITDGVGDVNGLSLAHLQCHMGMETLAWAMLGARAVGLDFSQPAIDKANQLRDELGLDARFICANVYDAVAEIGETFDIVFVSVGAICWLPDIDRWASVVAKLLKPGGRLYMNEAHPFTDVFDDADNEQGIAVKYAYLDPSGIHFDIPGSYAAPDGQFKHNKTVDHIHSIGSVLNALINQGLVIDQLIESNQCMWPRFKSMQQVGPDHWTSTDPVLAQLPHTYTLKAHA